MWNSVALRGDFAASEVGALWLRLKDASQVRRLLSIAAVSDGMDREEAARIGGMDRQTLRDWVHRFNSEGPDGLIDRWGGGKRPRLTGHFGPELRRFVLAQSHQGQVTVPRIVAQLHDLGIEIS